MTEIKRCPFCGGEAHIAEIASGGIVTAYTACCNAIGKCIASDPMRYYATEAEAVAAWNTRAELGSDTKPCYAADENYKRCKYSVNRGWCDDAPFIVWDDTGHLFITMGGLKTWDVTDDAKKWFAELANGTLTAEQVRDAVLENFEEAHETRYDHWEPSKFDWQAIADELNARAERTCHIIPASRKYVLSDGTEAFEDGCSECGEYVAEYDNFCPNCGAKVVDA